MMSVWSRLSFGLGGAAALSGCAPDKILSTAEAYYGDQGVEVVAERAAHLAQVMPFYVVGTALAVGLMVVTVLNALEHARSLGRGETLRLGAYILLLCFVGLFLAMSAERSWIPAGHPVLAFLTTAVTSASLTAALARAHPARAVLLVGYLSVTLLLPLFGLLISREIRLMDTTASLFIGFASGFLVTIVLSDPVRGGLVDFLRMKEGEKKPKPSR